MSKNENMLPLDDQLLDTVGGGTAVPGSVMVCMANAPLYAGNPAGNQGRSVTNTLDTVQAGTSVKLFEYGAKHSKVIANGKVGWIETALLADK